MKKGISEKRNRKAEQQKKDERGQRNEKFKGVGNVKLIKGRNLPKGEGRDEWEDIGASEKSRILQKKKKVWEALSESQRIRRKEKEQEGEFQKEAQGI